MNGKEIKVGLVKAGPHILTGLSVASTIGAVYASHVETKRALYILDQYSFEKKIPVGKIPKKNAAKLTWRCYWKTYLLTALSMGAAIASDRLSSLQIAELSTALAYAYTHRNKLADQLAVVLDDPGLLRDVKTEMISDMWMPSQTVEDTGYGNLLCIDTYSGRWFLSSKEAVEEAIDRFNDIYKNRGDRIIYLNDLYNELGITKTHFGYQYGWPESCDSKEEALSITTDILPDFPVDDGVTMAGRPLLVIDFESEFSCPIETWSYY